MEMNVGQWRAYGQKWAGSDGKKMQHFWKSNEIKISSLEVLAS